MSETDKHRHLAAPYCEGNGIDIGSSGYPIVPWAIQLDLPYGDYLTYNPNRPDVAIHWRGDCRNLPFKDGVADWLHCLPTGTPVLTSGGVKEIEQVTEGDAVYGSDGGWHKVTTVYQKRHIGVLSRCRLPGNAFDLLATDNHRVPIIREGVRQLVSTGEVVAGDYLVVPYSTAVRETPWFETKNCLPGNASYEKVFELRSQGCTIDEIALATGLPRSTVWQWYTKRKTPWDAYRIEDGEVVSGANTKRMPERIAIDDEFLRLIGYYVSDGCASNSEPFSVAFYFGKEETRFRDDVVSIMQRRFGIIPVEDDAEVKPNMAYARFCSKILWHIFRYFGGEPRDKHLAGVLMSLDPNLQKSLLSGLWRGDGSVSKSGHGAYYASSSLQLAFQVRELLLRQGWTAGMSKRRNVDPRGNGDHTLYCVRVGGRTVDEISALADKLTDPMKGCRHVKKKNAKYLLGEGFCGLLVTEVSKETYDGMVYDLTIDGETTPDHLFMASGVLVHNSSHVLEDFADWHPVLAEWSRVVRPGGFILISIPDHHRFREAVANGQGDNLGHKHEGFVGEISSYLEPHYHVIRDDFVTADPHEYSILFIGRKKMLGGG